jgi:hypothetical protein
VKLANRPKRTAALEATGITLAPNPHAQVVLVVTGWICTPIQPRPACGALSLAFAVDAAGEHRLAGTARAKEKCGGSEARAGGKKDRTPRRTSAIQFVSRTDHSVSIGLMARRAPCWVAK